MPTGFRPDTSTLDDTLPIRQAIAELSSHFGDQAPRASGTRAAALYVESDRTLPDFLHTVKEAATITCDRVPAIDRRGYAGEVNAIPYFFAILEELLKVPDAGKPMATSPEVPSQHSPDESPIEAHPLWRAILNELRAVLPPRTFRERVADTHVILEEESRLLIAVSSPFLREWLPRTLARQLREALAALGKPDLRLEFVHAAGTTGTPS
ncbi:MAG TPA: DnaA N-terminal domain-containing protein [Chloroflexota bacterium]|nr:DnaA N-terminal domain-containing protein [Chloroflexota bacterium]